MRGSAIYAQGQCDCWTGYEGTACDLCTAGYMPVDTQCLRTYNSFQGYTIPPPQPSVSIHMRPYAYLYFKLRGHVKISLGTADGQIRHRHEKATGRLWLPHSKCAVYASRASKQLHMCIVSQYAEKLIKFLANATLLILSFRYAQASMLEVIPVAR